MKLIRYGEPGFEKPGVILSDGRRIDVSAGVRDYNERFFAVDGISRLNSWLVDQSLGAMEIPASARLGPPIARPSKIVCVGLNYKDHAEEAGAKPPEEPVLFFKATSALAGPFDDVVIPKNSTKTD